jgi:hypothetical protein
MGWLLPIAGLTARQKVPVAAHAARPSVSLGDVGAPCRTDRAARRSRRLLMPGVLPEIYIDDAGATRSLSAADYHRRLRL